MLTFCLETVPWRGCTCATFPATSSRRQQAHLLQHVVIPSFRVPPFDLEAALHSGAAMGEGQCVGAVPPNDDAKFAAVAAVRGLTVATGNARDFERLGVPWLDPGGS